MCLQVETPLRDQAVKSSQKSTSFMLVFMGRLAAGADIIYNFNTLCLDIYTLCISTHTVSTHYVSTHYVSIHSVSIHTLYLQTLYLHTLYLHTLYLHTLYLHTLYLHIIVQDCGVPISPGRRDEDGREVQTPGRGHPCWRGGLQGGDTRYLQELPEWRCRV